MDKQIPPVPRQVPDGRQKPVARQTRFLLVPWLAMFTVSFHIYAMAAILPSIVRSLDTTIGTVQAAIVLSTLVAASFVPTSENLSKMHGAKRLFVLGLITFVVGITVTASSPNVSVLILGTSVLTSLAMAPLVSMPWDWTEHSFEGRRRDLAEVALSAAAVFGSLLGPLLCGRIATAMGWRWALSPQLVLAILVLWMARTLPESPITKGVPVDWIGGLLSVIGLGAVLVGSSLAGQYGWWTPRQHFVVLGVTIPPFSVSIVPFLIGIGAVFIGAAIFWQRRQATRGKNPLWRIGTFRNRPFLAALITGTLYTVTSAGVTYSLYIFLPSMLGLAPVQTVLAVFPVTLATAVFMLATSQLGRWIARKYVVQLGLVVLAIGLYLLYRTIDSDLTTGRLLLGLIVTGAGGGLVVGQIAGLAFSIAKPKESSESGLLPAEAVGIYSIFQDLAYSLGTAVFGTILISVACTGIVDGVLGRAAIVVDANERQEIIFDFQEMVQTFTVQEIDTEIAGWPEEVQRAFEEVTPAALVDAMQVTLLVILAMISLALAVSLFLPRTKMTG